MANMLHNSALYQHRAELHISEILHETNTNCWISFFELSHTTKIIWECTMIELSFLDYQAIHINSDEVRSLPQS